MVLCIKSSITPIWQQFSRTTLWCRELPDIISLQLLLILKCTSWLLYCHSKICYKIINIYKHLNINRILLTLDVGSVWINENVCAEASSKHHMKRKRHGWNPICLLVFFSLNIVLMPSNQFPYSKMRLSWYVI